MAVVYDKKVKRATEGCEVASLPNQALCTEGCCMRNMESRPQAQHRWVSLVLVGVLSVSGLAVSVLPTAADSGDSAAGLFSPTTPSGYTVYNDSAPVELGVRFSAKVSGSVTGVRVFKAVKASSATPLSGTLWSPSGQRLATAAFDRKRATGWQSVTFSRPVPLTVGLTYTVSVFAWSGKYAATDYGFMQAKSTESLTAPATGNGVYTYSGASSFPRNTHKASNYWVDVQFVPTMSAGGAPRTSPATTAPATTAPATTAPTTTAPTPTSPSSSQSGTAPSSDLKGWELNATNVGLAPHGLSCATLPVYTGSLKPARGARISKVRVTGPLDLSNGDIIVEKSCIKPNKTGYHNSFLITTTTCESKCYATAVGNVIVRDSEIDTTHLSASTIARSCGFLGIGTVQRNYMHGMGSGVCFFETGLVHSGLAQQNYVTDLRSDSTSHNEAATVRDLRKNAADDRTIKFINNRLDCRSGNVTGGLFIQPTWVDIYHVTAMGNYFEGDGYNFYVDKPGVATYSDIHVTDNRFRSTGWGPAAVGSGPGVAEWSGNYRFDPTQLDGKGAVVPKP